MGGRWLAQSGNCMRWWKVSIQTNSLISALKEASTAVLFTAPAAPHQNRRAGSESFRVVHMPARSRKSRKSTPYVLCSK